MTPLEELAGLRRLARSLAGSDADADDLLQEAALTILERQPEVEHSMRGYLATVIRNRWRMDRRALLRRRAREHALEPAPPPELAEGQDVDRLLGRLAEPYRRLVVARYLEGKTSIELARELGIPAVTVRTRLWRALTALREDTDP